MSIYFLNYCGPNDESSQSNVRRILAEKLKTVNVENNCQFISAWDWNPIFGKSLDSMGRYPSLIFKSLQE